MLGLFKKGPRDTKCGDGHNDGKGRQHRPLDPTCLLTKPQAKANGERKDEIPVFEKCLDLIHSSSVYITNYPFKLIVLNGLHVAGT